jgi:hypothetical protein
LWLVGARILRGWEACCITISVFRMHLIACEAGVKRRNILLALEAGFAAVGILLASTASISAFPPRLFFFSREHETLGLEFG